jgi:hypothetical protein
VQAFAARTCVPQVFVWLKLLAFVPLIEIPRIFTVAELELVSVAA